MKNTKYLAAGLLGLAFLCWPCPGIHAAESRHLAQMSHDPGGFEKLTWNETLPSMQKKFVLEYLGKEAAGQHYAAILPNKKNELDIKGPIAAELIFYSQKLKAVIIYMSGPYTHRYEAVKELYGTPAIKGDAYAYWEGPQSYISLSQEDAYITLRLTSRKIE